MNVLNRFPVPLLLGPQPGRANARPASALLATGYCRGAGRPFFCWAFKSNGAVIKGSANTGTDGVAVYKLRLKKQDPTGTYRAAAVAIQDGVSVDAATVFTVL